MFLVLLHPNSYLKISPFNYLHSQFCMSSGVVAAAPPSLLGTGRAQGGPRASSEGAAAPAWPALLLFFVKLLLWQLSLLWEASPKLIFILQSILKMLEGGVFAENLINL